LVRPWTTRCAWAPFDLFNVEKAADGIEWKARIRERPLVEALPLFLSYRPPTGRTSYETAYDPEAEARWKALIGEDVPTEPWRPAAELVAEEATDDNSQGALPLRLAGFFPQIIYSLAVPNYENPWDPSITEMLNIPPQEEPPVFDRQPIIVGFPDDLYRARTGEQVDEYE
jgi:hypothetical protein